jgi:hypothetical protein
MQSTLVASLKIQSLDWSGGGVGGNRARAFALFGARSCNLSCPPLSLDGAVALSHRGKPAGQQQPQITGWCVFASHA